MHRRPYLPTIDTMHLRDLNAYDPSRYPSLIFRYYNMCIFFLYMLLRVVSHYDFSVLSMLVIGFQNKIG